MIEEYVPQIIATAVIAICLPIAKYLVKNIILRSGRLLHKTDIRVGQVKQITSVLLNVTFVILLAIIWGVKPENLLVGLSSVFAVIGVAFFAQWSILSNITAGIVMFFSAPYRLGNRIQLMDKDYPTEAVIENIYTFYTYVRTDDGELVVLPNNLFLQKAVMVKQEKRQDEEDL